MCNAAGQTFGYAFAFIGALAMDHFKVLDFSQFMFACGVAFLVTTVAVGLFKSEKPVAADEECESVGEVDLQSSVWCHTARRGYEEEDTDITDLL